MDRRNFVQTFIYWWVLWLAVLRNKTVNTSMQELVWISVFWVYSTTGIAESQSSSMSDFWCWGGDVVETQDHPSLVLGLQVCVTQWLLLDFSFPQHRWHLAFLLAVVRVPISLYTSNTCYLLPPLKPPYWVWSGILVWSWFALVHGLKKGTWQSVPLPTETPCWPENALNLNSVLSPSLFG